MIVPSPLQYLASHAIAFAVGALSTVVLHLYGKRQRSAGARDAGQGNA